MSNVSLQLGACPWKTPRVTGDYPIASDSHATDRDKTEVVLRRDWPNLKRPHDRSESMVGYDYLEPHEHTGSDEENENWY
jgi:hypothetical protein